MSATLSAKTIAESTVATVAASVQVGEVVTRLQRERGMTRFQINVSLLSITVHLIYNYFSQFVSQLEQVSGYRGAVDQFTNSSIKCLRSASRSVYSSDMTWNNLINLRASTEQGITAVSLWPGKPEDVHWLTTPRSFQYAVYRV